eukprot:NODE_4881_length_416_cov_571.098093_g3884_i0.p1 GENE.NODE_4881_length_416_cov_571.098093_g3884_i0~~NODE_4881_length_416_cov_571.098093_g3884_i0.p1  ORF type:complete len:110 (+),score=53.80 NODE_4881_length_416_cov_571.098093_g3884_i0:35-331(+)
MGEAKRYGRFNVEVHFSSGMHVNPFGTHAKHHVDNVQPMIAIHRGINFEVFKKLTQVVDEEVSAQKVSEAGKKEKKDKEKKEKKEEKDKKKAEKENKS